MFPVLVYRTSQSAAVTVRCFLRSRFELEKEHQLATERALTIRTDNQSAMKRKANLGKNSAAVQVALVHAGR
jgi:hypothetical protein